MPTSCSAIDDRTRSSSDASSFKTLVEGLDPIAPEPVEGASSLVESVDDAVLECGKLGG